MTSKIQTFGGSHTERKLDVVAKYLSAYVTVMKKQNFELHYVDGSAGSGEPRAFRYDSGEGSHLSNPVPEVFSPET